MPVSYVFERYEMKYLLTEEDYRTVFNEICRRLEPDKYGATTIQSLYYDTADDRLVRASIEKPVYKEKLRLRCYGRNDNDKDVFLEMKRKYDGVVYKRRISCKESKVSDYFKGQNDASQIGREMNYFISFYGDLKPKVLILYDRTAFYDTESDLRITFDRNIRYRTEMLGFNYPLDGKMLLPSEMVLMEIKTGTAMPLWLTHLLSRNHIVKTAFSKYGEAYLELQNELREKQKLLRSKIICLNPFLQTTLLKPEISSSC